MIVDSFVKIVLSNALRRFKSAIPKKKKQSLSFKIQALGEKRDTSQSKPKRTHGEQNNNTDDICFYCSVCEEIISENPVTFEEQSIGCDFCNKWCHHKCVAVKGNETFLKKENTKWKCPDCIKNCGKKLKIRK